MTDVDDVDKDKLVAQLRERMSDVEPLSRDDFFTRTDTLLRFLKARNWNVDEAEKQLKETVEWRREMEPLSVDCRWCHERPGYHCIRQIGFDKQQRPVIYACFAQSGCSDTTVDDSLIHMTHLFENAKRTMSGSTSMWVFIVDCTGMTLSACNPRVGYSLTNAMGTYYPERLGQVVCIHHSPVFQGVWNAFKVFLDPNTAAKMQMVRKKSRFSEAFYRLFDEELASWLLDEVKLNKYRPMPASQREFWKGQDDTSEPIATPPRSRKEKIQAIARRHDPRGCPSYVRQYVDTYMSNSSNSEPHQPTLHHPHPNIVDWLRGTIASAAVPPEDTAVGVVDGASNGHPSDASSAAAAGCDDSDLEDADRDDELQSPISATDIDERFQIPKHVYEQHQIKIKPQQNQ